MRYFLVRRLNEKASLALVVPFLILFAFLLSSTTNTITNVSGVETEGVGVYWDSYCTNKITEIDWGNLTRGSTKSLAVYIRNEGFEQIHLIMSTTNWNPPETSGHITLRWDYSLQPIDPSEVLQTTLILSISKNIEEMTSFSFDIVVTGWDSLPGDMDGDGDVDATDLFSYIAIAYGSKVGDPHYNPDCDFDGDGDVDPTDIFGYFSLFYGASA